ncbi:TMEM9 family protein [Megaselia abdita]
MIKNKYVIFAALVLFGICHAAEVVNKSSPITPTPTSNIPNTPAPIPKAILTNTSSPAIPAPSPKSCVCDAPFSRVENGKEIEICPECKCKYENRNSGLIKVVVIIVIWIISILVIYMLFLMCLDPLLNKRVKNNYQEHTNEDVDIKFSNIRYSLLTSLDRDEDDSFETENNKDS